MKRTVRTYEKIAGIAFFTATLGYGIGNSILQQAFQLLKGGSLPSTMNVYAGIGLELVNSLSVILIGYMLYLRLKPHFDKTMKVYVSFRVIEAVLLGAGSLLVLQTVSGSGLSPSALATLMETRLMLFSGAMTLLSLASLGVFTALLRTNYMPKALAVLGILGYGGTLLYGAMGLLNHGSANMALFAVGGIFELVFPLWLIVKGFKEDNSL